MILIKGIPRKTTIRVDRMTYSVSLTFGVDPYTRIGGTAKAPVWSCKKGLTYSETRDIFTSESQIKE